MTMPTPRSGRQKRYGDKVEEASDIIRAALTGRPGIYTDRRRLRIHMGDIIHVADASSHEDLTERCWARVLTRNWDSERQRLVKAELASQLQAYWENRFEFDLKPVPGRPGDWGVFFKVARPASPASRLLVTGLRQGNRFTSTEAGSSSHSTPWAPQECAWMGRHLQPRVRRARALPADRRVDWWFVDPGGERGPRGGGHCVLLA